MHARLERDWLTVAETITNCLRTPSRTDFRVCGPVHAFAVSKVISINYFDANASIVLVIVSIAWRQCNVAIVFDLLVLVLLVFFEDISHRGIASQAVET